MRIPSGGGEGKAIPISDNILFDRRANTIYLNKPRLAPEDEVALTFSKLLEELGIGYVVVAGYAAILFGRARRSDDIDFILESIGEGEFIMLCRAARERGFTLMQGDIESEESVRRVYREYLARGYGVRFMLRGLILPHVETKLATTSLHRQSLAGSVRVVVNEAYTTRISPLELQIAYKLYLASDKDVGDAVFLYTLFKNAINKQELSRWCGELRVDCRVLEAGEP